MHPAPFMRPVIILLLTLPKLATMMRLKSLLGKEIPALASPPLPLCATVAKKKEGKMRVKTWGAATRFVAPFPPTCLGTLDSAVPVPEAPGGRLFQMTAPVCRPCISTMTLIMGLVMEMPASLIVEPSVLHN